MKRKTLNTEERAAINAGRWFSGLSPSLRHELLRFSKVRRYDAGEQIFWRDVPAAELCACAAGAVRVSSTNVAGKPYTLTYIEPGAWFGETSLFDGGRHTYDAHAHGATALLCVQQADLQKILAEQIELYEALLAVSAKRARHLYELIQEARDLPLRTRLARRLTDLVRAYGVRLEERDRGSRIGLHLRQDDLAQLLGCSRPRVNEALKQLERSGLIKVAREGIVVYDTDELWRSSHPGVVLREHAGGHEQGAKRLAKNRAEHKGEIEKECMYLDGLQDIPALSDYLVCNVQREVTTWRRARPQPTGTSR